MKKGTVLIFVILLAAVIVVIMARDLLTSNPGRSGGNPYKLEIDSFLQVDPACRLAAIEGRKEAAFLEALGEGAEGLISHAVIEGFNYADGDEVVITLYGLTHEP